MHRYPVSVCLAVCILTCALSAFPDSSKTFPIRHVFDGPTVDGLIDPAWSTADSVSDFFQLSPFFGKEPDCRTTAKLLTTDDAIYCLIVCNDRPGNVQVNAGILDNFSGDAVSLMLDTFNDRRTAYRFAVSASGVRSDCRLLDDARNRDYNWDGVWFADARVYDWGYVVEMKIPYRSIQYDSKATSWGLDFDRWAPAEKEELYWNRYEENEGQRISKFGRLMFEDFHPGMEALNLEVYPVAATKTAYVRDGIYKFTPEAGVDIFYNPSQKLTFQLTANPDFAQIEADPFSFNISRYEVYFDERRPFFTQGNEVFMPSGRERNSGFYRPLELFYSRRIGRMIPGDGEVPLVLGAKAFGRLDDWEYGGFVAATGQKDYVLEGQPQHEPGAVFGSARVTRQILANSSVGVLAVGKRTAQDVNGVIDIDGAFRKSNLQFSYQIARSFFNRAGDVAGSFGFMMPGQQAVVAVRSRYVGDRFDVSQVGFVPWNGTWELTALGGPRWYFPEGPMTAVLILAGPSLYHENVDNYTDRSGVLVFNMQFRANWGFEIDISGGRSKDLNMMYDSYEIDFSSWCSISPHWDANLYGSFAKTYNFSRGYLAFFSSHGARIAWQAATFMNLGTSVNAYIEWNPGNEVEDVVLNARPYVSITPVNNLNVRLYVDNVYDRSTDKGERLLAGLLFSYNFLPKSWVYFAWNELQDRSDQYDAAGSVLPPRMHLVDRVAVVKVKYLYYF